MNSRKSYMNEIEKKICDAILTEDLSRDGIKGIVRALKMKDYVVSVILPENPGSESFGDFLRRFWNFDESPYFIEKRIVGQTAHRRYAHIMLRRAETYWIPFFKDVPVGDITLKDIKKRLRILASTPQMVGTTRKDSDGKQVFVKRTLRPETVNQIVRCATLALKWAYHNGITKNDCFSGIIWCRVVPEKRTVPTMTQAHRIFSADWTSDSIRLAHLISICTGMRIGEVQALQLKDIGKDRIFVRHSWSKNDGLKSPKNGTQREIIVSDKLISLMRSQADKNPFGQSPSNFLFWGTNRNAPRSSATWNQELHKITESMGIKNARKITFHCWRHFFSTNMADQVDLRKLQLATGHKSLEMLEHYASHQSELAIREVGQNSIRIFAPILELVKNRGQGL